MLREWRRILKPGGVLILEMPSMDKVFSYIAHCVKTKEDIFDFMTMNAFYGDPKHEDPMMTHKWGYFKNSILDLLEKVGMRNIVFPEVRYHFRFRDLRVECNK